MYVREWLTECNMTLNRGLVTNMQTVTYTSNIDS